MTDTADRVKKIVAEHLGGEEAKVTDTASFIDDLGAESWKALNMRTRYYTTKLHIGAFYLPAFLEEMLREVEEH